MLEVYRSNTHLWWHLSEELICQTHHCAWSMGFLIHQPVCNITQAIHQLHAVILVFPLVTFSLHCIGIIYRYLLGESKNITWPYINSSHLTSSDKTLNSYLYCTVQQFQMNTTVMITQFASSTFYTCCKRLYAEGSDRVTIITFFLLTHVHYRYSQFHFKFSASYLVFFLKMYWSLQTSTYRTVVIPFHMRR